MIPEIGHFALIVAALIALLLGTLPLIGAHTNRMAWVGLARPAATALALLVTFSFACLTQAFVANDFSVVYVAQHSNSLLPTQYRVADPGRGEIHRRIAGEEGQKCGIVTAE